MDPAQRRSVRESAAEVASLAATLRPDIDRDLDPARVVTVLARIRDLAAAVLADLEQPAPGRPPRPRGNVVGFRRATDPGHVPVAVAHVHRYGPNLLCLCGCRRDPTPPGAGPADLPADRYAGLDTADPTGYRHPHPRADGHLSWCRGDHDPTRTDCPPDHGFPWGYRAPDPAAD